MIRVAIVAGGRTPFVRARKALAAFGPLDLATHTIKNLVERSGVDPDLVRTIVFGSVVPEPGKPNLAREAVIESGLPRSIEGHTLSSYCITSLRSITALPLLPPGSDMAA